MAWPEKPFQTQWEYISDPRTGQPLWGREVPCPTGDHFPSKDQTDTLYRAGIDATAPDWEQIRGILLAERIPPEQIERLTIPAIVGILGRLYPPPVSTSEPTATDTEPKQDGNGHAEAAEEGETPPWRDPKKNTEDRLVALAHANPDCVDWKLRRLADTIGRSHTAVRDSQWNQTRKQNWELVEKERIRQ